MELGVQERQPTVKQRITNHNGAVVERYAYDAYGKPTIYAPDGVTVRSSSTLSNTQLYTGREYDRETGLYYYRARYTDPALGRFVRRDPAGYRGGENLYAYVGGQPTDLVDPLGLSPAGFFEYPDMYAGDESNWFTVRWLVQRSGPRLSVPPILTRIERLQLTARALNNAGWSNDAALTIKGYNLDRWYSQTSSAEPPPDWNPVLPDEEWRRRQMEGLPKVLSLLDVAASCACEPYDYFATGRDFLADPRQNWPLLVAAAVPFVPHQVGKLFVKSDTALDAARLADNLPGGGGSPPSGFVPPVSTDPVRPDIALGLIHHLPDFAKSVSDDIGRPVDIYPFPNTGIAKTGDTWQLIRDNMQAAPHIHFNMQDFKLSDFDVWRPINLDPNRKVLDNWTNNELMEVYSDPTLMGKTDFYSAPEDPFIPWPYGYPGVSPGGSSF